MQPVHDHDAAVASLGYVKHGKGDAHDAALDELRLAHRLPDEVALECRGHEEAVTLDALDNLGHRAGFGTNHDVVERVVGGLKVAWIAKAFELFDLLVGRAIVVCVGHGGLPASRG